MRVLMDRKAVCSSYEGNGSGSLESPAAAREAQAQEALAVDAGVDRSYVGRIERGLENPTVETLDRLATALQAVVAELLLAPKVGEKPPAPLRKGRKKK